MRTFLFCFLQILLLGTLSAQEQGDYIQAQTSVFFTLGTADNLYAQAERVNNVNNFPGNRNLNFNYAIGVGVETVRRNTAFRMHINRLHIEELRERSFVNENSGFGEIFSQEFISRTEVNQVNYQFTAGIYRYRQFGKWSFSLGAEIPVTFYDKYDYRFLNENKFDSASGTFSFRERNRQELTGELPSGYDIGFGMSAGVEVALTDWLQVGVNYPVGLRRYRIGGETDFKQVNSFFSQTTENGETFPPFEQTNTTELTENNETAANFDFYQRLNLSLKFVFN